MYIQCLGKSEIRTSQLFFQFALRCAFTFPRLIICWNLWNLFEIRFRTASFN